MFLILFHVTAFSSPSDAGYRLKWFDTGRLISQILLTASIAIHVISNVKPALITFGVRRARRYEGDILFVITVLLIFMAAAFVVYYLRWNRF